MRNILFFLIILLGQFVFGQRIPSSCKAPDSIIVRYKDDADRLALRRIQRNNFVSKSETTIPKPFSDTILRSLISVYNAKALPSRDTVIAMLNIHTFPRPVLNSFYIAADSNLTWVKNLKKRIFPSGQKSIDSIISVYSLKSGRSFRLLGDYLIPFESNNNHNFLPLTSFIKAKIQGITFCEIDGYVGDGNDISDSVYKDHVELTYSFGEGDCPSGCIYRRYWKFNVFFDCSVEFVKAYNNFDNIKSHNPESITVTPNPFLETISVNGIISNFSYAICNTLGQELKKGNSTSNTINNLDKLSSGIYILTLQAESKVSVFKIIKN